MLEPTEGQAVRRSLEDAGCSPDMIERFMECFDQGLCDRQLRLLSIHRACLLDCLHGTQRQLEGIDYLIYNLRKKYGEN